MIRGERVIEIEDARRSGDGQVSSQHLGYRDYDWWYAYYDKLKGFLLNPADWIIYSGGHNAVMNWEPSWNPETFANRFRFRNECELGKFFCEFNNSEFILRLAWGKEVNRDSTTLREILDFAKHALLKAGLDGKVRKSWNPNLYTTLAKKSFLKNEFLDLESVSKWVNDFIPRGFQAVCLAIVDSKRQ